MSNDKSQCRTVVLDGSNIISSGGNGADGRILCSAIEFYENLGYIVIPVMALRTIGHMLMNKRPGSHVIARMKKNNEIRTFAVDDDVAVIRIADKRNGWIVTYDTFSHGKEDEEGNVTPSERERYPDWDWDDIDERTRGTEKKPDGHMVSGRHWGVDGTDFYDPSMPKAPKELLSGEYAEFRRNLNVAIRSMDRITIFLDEQEPEELTLTKIMGKKTARIRREIAELIEMVPTSQLPEDATIDKFLVAELRQLIEEINEIDPDAKLKSGGKKSEIVSRIKKYTEKARGQRRQAEAEVEARLKAKLEEREAAEEAGMTLSKYRKSQRNKAKKKAKKAKAEDREKAKRKILEEKSADEISSIVISAFKEILGDDFKGDLEVSLDIENLEINCKPSSRSHKRKRILIGKDGSTIKQVVKQTSEKLGIDWIRVIIV